MAISRPAGLPAPRVESRRPAGAGRASRGPSSSFFWRRASCSTSGSPSTRRSARSTTASTRSSRGASRSSSALHTSGAPDRRPGLLEGRRQHDHLGSRRPDPRRRHRPAARALPLRQGSRSRVSSAWCGSPRCSSPTSSSGSSGYGSTTSSGAWPTSCCGGSGSPGWRTRALGRPEDCPLVGHVHPRLEVDGLQHGGVPGRAATRCRPRSWRRRHLDNCGWRGGSSS